MLITPERDGAQIMLVGAFNPRIFNPLWFVKHGLFDENDLQDDSLQILHPDIAKFNTPGISIEVQKDRFTATTFAAPLLNLHDLAVTLFGELLPHTPVSLVGLNRIVDFKLASSDKYSAFGEALAPRAPWGTWGEKLGVSGTKISGLVNIEMDQQDVDGRSEGWVKTRVSAMSVATLAVNVLVNDHYPLKCDDKFAEDGAGTAEYVRKNWHSSMSSSREIINDLMKLAKNV